MPDFGGGELHTPGLPCCNHCAAQQGAALPPALHRCSSVCCCMHCVSAALPVLSSKGTQRGVATCIAGAESIAKSGKMLQAQGGCQECPTLAVVS